MRKVTHLIPYDGIGGVERAASSMGTVIYDEINFSIKVIFPSEATTSRLVIWNPWYYLKAVAVLWHNKPDVLIVSLWRAYFVGILLKLIRPSIRLVVFLHYPKHVHGVDEILTGLSVCMATNIWADSQTTLVNRLPSFLMSKGRVLSFVTEHIAPVIKRAVPSPVFIFWGRIHAQKRLARALGIFAAVHAVEPSARFLIIGPDGGDLASITEIVGKLELDKAVDFLGPMNFSDIRLVAADASFYLQTSELEGMAMSVVEAMQLGLVPVVTPVGEIAHYARSGENAVVIGDDLTAVSEVLAVLGKETQYQMMQENAITTWLNKPLYKEDVLQASRDILKLKNHEQF